MPIKMCDMWPGLGIWYTGNESLSCKRQEREKIEQVCDRVRNKDRRRETKKSIELCYDIAQPVSILNRFNLLTYLTIFLLFSFVCLIEYRRISFVFEMFRVQASKRKLTMSNCTYVEKKRTINERKNWPPRKCSYTAGVKKKLRKEKKKERKKGGEKKAHLIFFSVFARSMQNDDSCKLYVFIGMIWC